jgi:multiple sugar transport system permease protein
MTANSSSSRMANRPSALTVILWLAAFVWVIPIAWTVSLSLTPNETLRAEAVGLVPKGATLDNFVSLFEVSLFPRWLLNSAIVSIGSTIGVVALCSLAGYALARMTFRSRRVLFALIMAGVMIPDHAVFIPRHVLFSDLGLSNSYLGLSLPRLALPLGVFLMFQFFRAIPRDIEEAAALDGAGSWTTFRRVILPLSRPAMVTLGIFSFIQAWNDFLWPLVSTNKPEMYTVTIGLATLQSDLAQTEGLGSLMATAVVTSIPILLVFLVFQRYLIEGVRGTARF